MRAIGAATVWAENTPGDYLPLFLLLGLAVLLGATQLIVSHVLGKRGVPSPAKDSAYECGIEAETPAHPRFSVTVYLVAVLFILFDVEVIFFYPWAVFFGGGEPAGVFENRQALMQFAFFEMMVFLGILFLGWYWVVKKRALDWEDA